MTISFDETRRLFLRRMAAASMAAGSMGLSRSSGLMGEPTNCSGPTPPQSPIHWTPDTNPVLPRLAASSLSAPDVARLRSAYTALRKLTQTDPDDPRGWLQQGNKHCWNCGGGLDAQAGEEIHFSWLFLPWHRAFLYFHERILGALINDKNLRLAYWDWDDPAHNQVPSGWLTPNDVSNPLWDAQRSAVAGSLIPASLVGPKIMTPILTAPSFDAFGGTATRAGNLERVPHGGVHIWSGDTSQLSQRADMGLLDTAAQDPLFFTHHSNIDRLWDVWLSQLPHLPSRVNPTASEWLNHRFTFWDEQKRWVYITVADVINSNMSSNLRYTYESSTPQPLPVAHLATPRILTLATDRNAALMIPDETRARLAASGDNQSRLMTLRIEDIKLPDDAEGIYRIFASRADAAASSSDSYDVGYVAIIPRSSADHGGHTHGALTVDLNVADGLPVLARQTDTLRLSYARPGAGAVKNQLIYGSVSLIER